MLLALVLAMDTPPEPTAAEAPPAPAAAPEPLRAPVLLEAVTPEYPAQARAAGVQGQVTLRLTVGADGAVRDAALLSSSGNELLDLSALEASRRLRFEPAHLGETPVEVQIDYRFRFDLGLTDQTGTTVPGSLEGSVLSPEGVPLGGAVVMVYSLDRSDFELLTFRTQKDGSFRATFLPSGSYELVVQSEGYEDLVSNFEVKAGETLKRQLQLSEEGAYEVLVVDDRTWRDVQRAPLEPDTGTVTGSYTLTRRDIESTPGSLEDVSRAVHSLPGVVSDGDMLATFNARGGGTDEVVFLLDRVPLDNPFHLAGFNSLFNPDLISTVDFYLGTAPADVPAATSAVLSVETWDGKPRQDASDLDGAIDISASSMRALLMGPVGERSAVSLAARRSYLESYFGVMKALNVVDGNFGAPEFSEISGRYAFTPNPQHRLMVTAMRSGDSLGIAPSDDSMIAIDATFQLDNHLNLVSADHTWTPREGVTVRSTTAWTQDRSFMLRDIGSELEQDIRSNRWYGRSDLMLDQGRHRFVTGVDYRYAWVQSEGAVEDPRLSPTQANLPLADYGFGTVELSSDLAYMESSGWVQDTWEGPVQLRAGLRGTWSGLTDQWLASPSAGFSVPLPTGTVPKASWGIYHKIPRDLRMHSAELGNPELRAETAMHVVVGLDQGFPLPLEGSGGLFRVEAYHITLSDLVMLAEDGSGYQNAGSGVNQGLDFLLGARLGRVRGMATYSLLQATRHNPLHDTWAVDYAPGQDQRHTLGVSLEAQLSLHWSATLRYSYHSGRPVSSIERASPSVDSFLISDVNDLRLGDFHNLDARAEWRKALENYRLSFYVEVLNLPNFHSDFVPIATIEDDQRVDSMFYHLPVRPFIGIRADF